MNSQRAIRRAAAGVAVGTLSAVWLEIGLAVAYEWQDGPSKSCGAGDTVAISAFPYGDWNLYSNFGREAYDYDIPYNQQSYAWIQTVHRSVSDTDAEAENYVSGDVGVDCAVLVK